MTELLVILGALVTLTLSIAGMNFYLWWTDVLAGSYISNGDDEPTVRDQKTDRTRRVTAERRRMMRPLLQSWISDRIAPDPRRRITRYSSTWTIDLSRLRAGLQSRLLSLKGSQFENTAGPTTAKPASTWKKTTKALHNGANEIRSIL
jgi:hypothetical protein